METLVGVHPIMTEIEKRKLGLLEKLCNMTSDNMSKKIFIRRLFQYKTKNDNERQYGYVPDIFNILTKFNLRKYLDIFTSSNKFPTKYCWKQIVKEVNHLYRANDNVKCTKQYRPLSF